ncbi:P-loop NTPase family protein [Mastigocoleus testarum]|uniref:Uncharacterized protein n=1 Tax=Mastigocoleus testarum BC008 TaxID=371196 RepID=A0A0V7ZTF2_9CYAN|nr:hypothetical protein [Mastigocoleus testarum]KST67739.1 hypothetical protein BC008_44115 [Mastigocoleus testarum BC008]
MTLKPIIKSLRRIIKTITTEESKPSSKILSSGKHHLENYKTRYMHLSKDTNFRSCLGSISQKLRCQELRDKYQRKKKLWQQKIPTKKINPGGMIINDYLCAFLSFIYLTLGVTGLKMLMIINDQEKWLQRLPKLKDCISQLAQTKRILISLKTKIYRIRYNKLEFLTTGKLDGILSNLTQNWIKLGFPPLIIRNNYTSECKYRIQPILGGYTSLSLYLGKIASEVDISIHKYINNNLRMLRLVSTNSYDEISRIKACQDYRPGDYKYSNLAVLNQVSRLQICLQIDSGELEKKNRIIYSGFTALLSCYPNLQQRRLSDELGKIVNTYNYSHRISTPFSKEYIRKSWNVLTRISTRKVLGNISFVFYPDLVANTLKNVLFNIRARQTIRTVGASGSEQKTSINLPIGLYRLKSGRIIIDGYDIYLFFLKFLQKQLRVILQEFFSSLVLFSTA